jgi:phospholipid/cholesterol/gamma-HCH transport system substrate-binding protein
MGLSKEAKVGIFTVLGLAVLLTALFFTSKIQVASKGYSLNLRYNSVSGLKNGSDVKLAGGVKIGFIRRIEMVGNQINVQLWVNREYQIDRDAYFIISTSGLMGDKFIDIIVEKPTGLYYTNNEVVNGVNPVSFDALTIKIGNAVGSLFGGSMTSGDMQKSFVYLLKNTSELMYELNKTVGDNRGQVVRSVGLFADSVQIFNGQLKDILTSLNYSVKSLEGISRLNSDKLNAAIANLEASSVSLKSAALDAKDMTAAIRNKQGPLGRMIYDRELGDSLDSAIRNLEVFSKRVAAKGVLKY